LIPPLPYGRASVSGRSQDGGCSCYSMSASTLFHTVRHLKPVQIYRRIYRRRPTGSTPCVGIREATGHWVPVIKRENPRTGARTFRFLNEVRQIKTWNDPGIPKLWLYNLHYFEHTEPHLMREWVRENQPGHGNGWEPYPLSLRIVNWIKSGLPLDEESLATQAQYLSESVEYHLLANHLFANAKALVFAGTYFDCEPWLRQGLSILEEQIPEQILSDGGHFERSPMYHSIILEDLLDLISLSHAYPGILPDWSEPAARMLSWLRQMSHPDGRISFFNDAAFGVAPELRELEAYADRLGIASAAVPLGDSGYVRLEGGQTVVLFDAAPVGPDYQPGHAHADSLSFEMSYRGQRLIANSGVSTYEAGPERLRQRGTAAHNTVRIDQRDSSEVWAGFRVGRRARPCGVSTDNHTWVEAAHDGYRPVIHRRRLELRPGHLLVTDLIEGSDRHEVAIFFHMFPSSDPNLIRLDSALERSVEDATFHPQFNSSVASKAVVGRWCGLLPVTFSTFVDLT